MTKTFKLVVILSAHAPFESSDYVVAEHLHKGVDEDAKKTGMYPPEHIMHSVEEGPEHVRQSEWHD